MTNIKVLKNIVPEFSFLEELVTGGIGSITVYNRKNGYFDYRGTINSNIVNKIIRDTINKVIKELFPNSYKKYQPGMVMVIGSNNGGIKTRSSSSGLGLTMYWSFDNFYYDGELLTSRDILLVTDSENLELIPYTLFFSGFKIFEISIIDNYKYNAEKNSSG